jgi:A/G-specific adenine glycosylase
MTEPGFAQRLLAWFASQGRRDLPWQIERTPYRVWVSEIMLQQTQVSTVLPYFHAFMEAFPTVHDLAKAPVGRVLEQWSGLGYYARARNLHEAARRIVAEHGGQFPDRYEAVVALPGIGRSTAAAILAIAFGQRHAILDGNVKRVISRHRFIEGDPTKAAIQRKLWAWAEALTPEASLPEYTQAIMDLGATVCIRGRPFCQTCPVSADCEAYRLGIQQTLPTPRVRATDRIRQVVWVIAQDSGGRFLLERRPPAGIWGGLLSFPELPAETDPQSWLEGELEVSLPEGQYLSPVRHRFSHFELVATPVRWWLAATGNRVRDTDRLVWFHPGRDVGGLPAPTSRLLEQILA